MDQRTARNQAAAIGSAAVKAGITVDSPSNPDMGNLMALLNAAGLPVSTLTSA